MTASSPPLGRRKTEDGGRKGRMTEDGGRDAGRGLAFFSSAFRLAVLLGVVILAAGCGHGSSASRDKDRKAVEVVVTTPITHEVTDYQDFTGRLDAVKTVDIRARVSGYVTDAPFKEGDEVREGDLLFQIDPRPYKAALDAAEAQVAAAAAQVRVGEANVRLARVTLGRARAAGSAAAALEIDQDQAQAHVTEANLNLARANLGKARADLETAKLNFEWTKVRAPLSGRISRRNVDPGNLVTADTTLLTTIVTQDPLYAYFDVDERTYLDLMERAAHEARPGSPGAPHAGPSPPVLSVLMRLANEEQFTHRGTVNFLDNRLNANTGTIRMRGVFDNTGGYLKSGLFVRIRLPIGKPYPALLIPDEALQSDQGRKYVYVVKKEKDSKGKEVDRVEYRPVKLGQALQGLRVIRPAEKGKEGQEGLREGERVIITGMQRVRPKVEVRATLQKPPEPPPSPVGEMVTSNRRAARRQPAVAR
jgi:multidrug efflux system membrane fusion protein